MIFQAEVRISLTADFQREGEAARHEDARNFQKVITCMIGPANHEQDEEILKVFSGSHPCSFTTDTGNSFSISSRLRWLTPRLPSKRFAGSPFSLFLSLSYYHSIFHTCRIGRSNSY
jgi:hypothetical protein